ncbi:MAG: hypothetical protein HYX75_16935 [Acidobacteria bacterium]|nr:hypothetical protein [Acidobacteriota bacterium]
MILTDRCSEHLRSIDPCRSSSVILLLALATVLFPCVLQPHIAGADDAAAFFDNPGVHEIRITFADEGWGGCMEEIHQGHTGQEQPGRFVGGPARHVGTSVKPDEVGSRDAKTNARADAEC